MGIERQLTAAQKYTLRYLQPWEFIERHSNGDVTVGQGMGTGKQLVRISKEGMVLKRTSSSGQVATPHIPKQHTLSDDLSWDIKLPEKKKKSESTPAQPKSSSYGYGYTTTICQENPECCQKKEIKHVAWDADHTIWNMPGTAASVTGKLKLIDENTVVELGQSYSSPKYKQLKESDLTAGEIALLEGLSDDEKEFYLDELSQEHYKFEHPNEISGSSNYRTTIRLFPTFRKTLEELEKRHITSSIISLNTPGSVKRILKEFGLLDRFVEVADSYENKGSVFKKQTHTLGVCPCNAIFVDDTRHNVQDVSDKCGTALQIGKGKDIEEPIEVLKFIKD